MNIVRSHHCVVVSLVVVSPFFFLRRCFRTLSRYWVNLTMLRRIVRTNHWFARTILWTTTHAFLQRFKWALAKNLRTFFSKTVA
jgi:hypothetical protein